MREEARKDDTAECFTAKLETFKSRVQLVLDYYTRFGKIRTVDGNRTANEVHEQILKALFPMTYFAIGPCAGGKSTACATLAKRANMKHIVFQDLIVKKGLESSRHNHDLLTRALIQELSGERSPRVIVDGFPECSRQLQFYAANAIAPDKVLYIEASETSCLQRNQELGSKHPHYVPPAILCRRIKEFHEQVKDIIAVCKQKNWLCTISNGETVSQKQLEEQLAAVVAPEILLARSHENAQEAMMGMVIELSVERGYQHLDVPFFRREEISRNSRLGKEMARFTAEKQPVPALLLIELLRNIIYGASAHSKFVLTGFPESLEDLRLFEASCAAITREFYFRPTSDPYLIDPSDAEIEMELHMRNRLTILREFIFDDMEKYYGRHLQYVLIFGYPLSGKTTVAKRLDKCGFTLLDFPTLSEDVKKKLATEETPAESISVTFEQTLAELKNRTLGRKDKKERFVLDTLPLDSPDSLKKLFEALGPPAYYLELSCDLKELKRRHLKKNELSELTEEQAAELDKLYEQYAGIQKQFHKFADDSNVRFYAVPTDVPEDRVQLQIKGLFEPKLLLLRHDFGPAAQKALINLSIRYAYLYVDVSALLQREIEQRSELGVLVQRTKKPKELAEPYAKNPEANYCAVHFNFKAVLQVVKTAIARMREQQRFVVVDGLLNSHKLKNLQDRLEIRSMDELFGIEQELGSIKTILTFTSNEYEKVEDDRAAVRPSPPPKKESAKAEPAKEEKADEAPPVEKPPEEEGSCDIQGVGKEAKTAFKPEDFAWTNTQDNPRTLGQLFTTWKKCPHKALGPQELPGTLGPNPRVEQVLDSLLNSAINGDLGKDTIYVQVKLAH